MPDHEKEQKAREAHVEKIESDTRKERAKTDERSGIDKEVENELQTVCPGADAELMANAADNQERLPVWV